MVLFNKRATSYNWVCAMILELLERSGSDLCTHHIRPRLRNPSKMCPYRARPRLTAPTDDTAVLCKYLSIYAVTLLVSPKICYLL